MIGIDEAGRGAWAGALVAVAVRLPQTLSFKHELQDSKLLSPKIRVKLAKLLEEKVSFRIGIASAELISKFGLSYAQHQAMLQAAAGLKPLKSEKIILDGKVNYLAKDYTNSWALVKGDQLIFEIKAASILAKVKRDQMMLELSQSYPGYGFAKHKGYGTKQHLQALKELGVLQTIHRLNYRPIRALI